jgi:hypothetical protein
LFFILYSKLVKELHEKKKEMALIIEQSNIAYEARDQAHSEMALLKAQADKEQSIFEVEWRELGRVLNDIRSNKLKWANADKAHLFSKSQCPSVCAISIKLLSTHF